MANFHSENLNRSTGKYIKKGPTVSQIGWSPHTVSTHHTLLEKACKLVKKRDSVLLDLTEVENEMTLTYKHDIFTIIFL